MPPKHEARFLTAFEDLMLRWKDADVDFFVPQLAAVLMTKGVPSRNVHVSGKGQEKRRAYTLLGGGEGGVKRKGQKTRGQVLGKEAEELASYAKENFCHYFTAEN